MTFVIDYNNERCSDHPVLQIIIHLKFSHRQMKGSPCCAGLMRSCLHTYRTKTNLTQHIIQPLGGGGSSAKYGGVINQLWEGVISQVWGGIINQLWGGVISQVWGGHQPTMGGSSAKYGGSSTNYGGGHQPSMGGSSTNYGGVISQVWGGHQPTMGGGGIFPPVCTGSQNRENYFSNTYVLPSVNRTAGPTMLGQRVMCIKVQPLFCKLRNFVASKRYDPPTEIY